MFAGHLEAELLAFLRPDETADQFLARTFVEPFYTGVSLLDSQIALRPGNVLELAGAAGSGKTELLVQIAANCILPPAFDGLLLGGRAENVLLFDLDCKFDLLRLLQVLHARVAKAMKAARVRDNSEMDEDAAVNDSLTRLHLVQCRSSFDLLASLAVVRPLLTHLEANGGIRCLLIDNISAFYYLDKVGRGPGGGTIPALGGADVTRDGAPLTMHRVHAAIAQSLRYLVREHRLAGVVTKNLLLPGARNAERSGDPWAYRDFMSKPWQELVTHRLHLMALLGRGQYGAAASVMAEEVHVAKWEEPPVDAAIRFVVTEGAVELVL